jgi:hypothetical protein
MANHLVRGLVGRLLAAILAKHAVLKGKRKPVGKHENGGASQQDHGQHQPGRTRGLHDKSVHHTAPAAEKREHPHHRVNAAVDRQQLKTTFV